MPTILKALSANGTTIEDGKTLLAVASRIFLLQNMVSIVFGDPRYRQAVSEQKRAYTVQEPEGQRYAM